MMEEKRIEINAIDINNNPRRQQRIEEDRKRELNHQQQLGENKRKSVKRNRRKKMIQKLAFVGAVLLIARAGVYVGEQIYEVGDFTNSPVEHTAHNIWVNVRDGERKESEVIKEYAEKSVALEQEMQYNEQSSNSKLSQVADGTQEKVDVQISKLADKMLEDFGSLSSEELKTSCFKRTDDKQSSFYDFSLYHKKSVTLNWLKKYFDYSQIENIYNRLSEEEINALIAFTTYNCIDVYEGGPNNRETFLRNLGFTSDQSDEEKLAIAKKMANQVSFNIAKESLTQELGYSLDIETESVGRGK